MGYQAGNAYYLVATYIDPTGNAIAFDSGAAPIAYFKRNGTLQDGSGSTANTTTTGSAVANVTGSWAFAMTIPGGWTNGSDVVGVVIHYVLNGNTVEDTYDIPPFKLDAAGTNVTQIGGQNVALDGNNLLKVDVEDWHGVAIASSVPLAASAYTPPDNSDIANLVTSVGSGLGSLAAAIKAKTDNLPSVPAAQSDVLDVWTTAMTEAYAASGAAMTPAEALYMIYSVCAQFAVSGTNIVAKKLDGETTALTFAMDSAEAPTERTRSG